MASGEFVHEKHTTWGKLKKNRGKQRGGGGER